MIWGCASASFSKPSVLLPCCRQRCVNLCPYVGCVLYVECSFHIECALHMECVLWLDILHRAYRRVNLSHTHTFSLARALSHILRTAYRHCDTHTFSLSLSLSLSHTHTFSLSFSLSLSHRAPLRLKIRRYLQMPHVGLFCSLVGLFARY